MKSNWKKIILPCIVSLTSIGWFVSITATEQLPVNKVNKNKLVTVAVEDIFAIDHKVVITSYGEVTPLESTRLGSQVSGEVTYRNPNFIVGGFIKQGEVLLSIEKENYAAEVLESEATLLRVKATLIEELASANVAAETVKDSPNIKHSDLYLRRPQVLSARAEVKSAQAKLNQAHRNLEKCDIVAPYDSLVVSKGIGLGQYISVGTEVAVLNNIESAEVIIPIAGFEEVFLPSILGGIEAKIIQNDIKSFKREGFISRDIGVVDNATRMSNIVVNIPDPYGVNSDVRPLKFGAYVKVSFLGKTLKQVYRLPQELVNNQTVWVVNNKDELIPKHVEIIKEDGEFFLINEGLNIQDKLVVTLPEYPQKNMQVNVLYKGQVKSLVNL
ncbi:efflux RND transporter periplasmic adaptor subunit [Colwellia sp. Bg11-28]|uniref:efflux RND transporter periplasmic adaptor subunit n=1 Tax=Colwellia sp. Bg11-28 TaxID=2058305 RepID=UPI000C3442A4|nr:efflux RND transporter periplasmic adaptor subunit [Colwellia sp. Bg11-28]PKH85425.1 efflux RND transporter periplasmic adaptor subunit [Colwellia sp. Bg11-28]